MRLGRTWRGRALTSAVVVSTIVMGAATGAAEAAKHREKMDDSVVAAIRATAKNGGQLRLIVFGRQVDRARVGAGASLRHRLKLVRGQSVKIRPRDLARLLSSRGVSHVTVDVPVMPTVSPTPILFPALTTMHPIVVNASAAWNRGLSGDGVAIAVIDSGVAAAADFGNRIVQVQLPGQTATADTYGHGTFVAGIAAGSSPDGRHIGIAPRAGVYAINVARPDGTYTSDVIKGLDWVLANHQAHNIKVVNLSLSESAPSSYMQSMLDTAVERLWRAGVVVVASSGNRGANSASYAPANDPFIITVGALDTNDTVSDGDDAVASFSSSGQTQDGYAKPEIVAPGRRIVSSLPAGTALHGQAPLTSILEPGYAMMSGTSFSAPQVAGAAALLLEQHPDWSPDQIKTVLTATARSVSGSGARRLDLAAATAFNGVPTPANSGLAPTYYGLDPVATVDPNGASWNGASWNGASWNGASWNAASWNSFAWN